MQGYNPVKADRQHAYLYEKKYYLDDPKLTAEQRGAYVPADVSDQEHEHASLIQNQMASYDQYWFETNNNEAMSQEVYNLNPIRIIEQIKQMANTPHDT